MDTSEDLSEATRCARTMAHIFNEAKARYLEEGATTPTCGDDVKQIIEILREASRSMGGPE